MDKSKKNTNISYILSILNVIELVPGLKIEQAQKNP